MFKKLALQFNVGVLAIIAIVFTSYSIYDYNSMSSRLYAEQEDRAAITINSLSSTVGTALWNFELETVEKAVETTSKLKGMDIVLIQDVEKNIIAGFESKGGELTKISDMESLPVDAMVEHPIVIGAGTEDQKQVGSLFVKSNLDHIKNQLLSLIWSSVIKILIIALILITTISFLMKVLVLSPINEVVNALQDISVGDGDLTKRLPEKTQNEIGSLAIYFNRFIDRIHTMVSDAAQSSQQLSHATGNLKNIVDSTSDRANFQQAETAKVAQAIERLSDSSSSVASSSESAAQSANSANENAQEAMTVFDQTVQSVKRLASEFDNGAEQINSVQNSVNEIGSVLDVIGSIAEQTNLLALNAAIEAARAGEQGRGFAVVADEVRALAGRTQKSTGEIQEMIQRLEANASVAVNVMEVGCEFSQQSVDIANQAGKNIVSIVEHIAEVTNMSNSIADAVKDQGMVMQDVNNNVSQINVIAQETNTIAQEALDTSNMVDTASRRLETLVESFKTS